MVMNTTNRDYFTFNVDNSALVVGHTGSGKTEFVRQLIERLQEAQSTEEVKFVIFDMKVVEFSDTNKDYLYCDVITDPDTGLVKLDELAELAIQCSESGTNKPQIFIYIEECDIAAVDQKRFNKAVITINNNALKANMKLIYSTSRPSPDVVSKELIESFDLILAGTLASTADERYLGIPNGMSTKLHEFVVKDNNS